MSLMTSTVVVEAEAEAVSKKLHINSIFIYLITWEEFIALSHC
jgi:hypothetical protein